MSFHRFSIFWALCSQARASPNLPTLSLSEQTPCGSQVREWCPHTNLVHVVLEYFSGFLWSHGSYRKQQCAILNPSQGRELFIQDLLMRQHVSLPMQRTSRSTGMCSQWQSYLGIEYNSASGSWKFTNAFFCRSNLQDVYVQASLQTSQYTWSIVLNLLINK